MDVESAFNLNAQKASELQSLMNNRTKTNGVKTAPQEANFISDPLTAVISLFPQNIHNFNNKVTLFILFTDEIWRRVVNGKDVATRRKRYEQRKGSKDRQMSINL